MIYVKEGAGPDDQDLILFGVYECPECERTVTVPEYFLGLTIPYCSECQAKGKQVQFKLIRTYWDVEPNWDEEDDEEWE